MAKFKKEIKRKQRLDALDRIITAVKEGSVYDARRVVEIVEAFDKKMPPEEFAAIMADGIRSDNAKERSMCMAFILSAKKFHEKNDREVDDEEIDSLNLEQTKAILKQVFGQELGTDGIKDHKRDDSAPAGVPVRAADGVRAPEAVPDDAPEKEAVPEAGK